MNFSYLKNGSFDPPGSAGELSKPLFVAIPLPASVVKMITFFLENNKHLNINWIALKNYHVTLLYIGKVDPEIFPELQSRISECIKNIPPFTLLFKEIEVIRNKGREGMIWARFDDNEEFTTASHSILDALSSLVKINVSFKKPVPHVTLSRLKRSADITRMNFTIPEDVIKIAVKHCELWESNKDEKGTYYKRKTTFDLAD